MFLAISVLSGILAVVFVLLCAFMVLVILIQKPKGGGLSGAFGGGGGGQTAAFGAKTGDVLTWFTVASFIVFLSLGIGLVYSTRQDAAVTGPPVRVAPEDEGAAPAEPEPDVPVTPSLPLPDEPVDPATPPEPSP